MPKKNRASQETGQAAQKSKRTRRSRSKEGRPADHTREREESHLPDGYVELLADLKGRIRTAQTRASLAINRELVRLYWDIGRAIVERQRGESWGAGVIPRLATDLRREFPEVRGFSPSNIWRMRAFYLAHSTSAPILAQAVRELGDEKLARPVRETGLEEPPAAFTEIPWGHNLLLLERLSNTTERIWYAQQTVLHGWSRHVLALHIETQLHRRQGRAITNFENTLPPAQSDLARQLLKDPYTFEFLTISEHAQEREIERALLAKLERFLLELGKGFAFVGRQYRLEVGGEEFSIDLLFYHLVLRCFVVIDLKTEPFKPEFAGKMNFYTAAIDDQLRHPSDHSSIGLILCKDRNRIVVEYALRDNNRPLGVATYRMLSRRLKDGLPAPTELEAELRDAFREENAGTASAAAPRCRTRRRHVPGK